MSDVEVVEATEVVHVTAQEPAEASLWRHFGKLGNMLSASSFVPQSFRTKVRDENGLLVEIVKPLEVMAAIAYGHEIGIGPMQSLQSFDVIQGKPTLKPETMRALIRSAGHSLVRTEASDTAVTFRGKRRDNGDEETVTYTIEDARALGLTGKDNWKKQPRAMLTARATAEIARSLFSDVIMGASYTAEELEFVPVDDLPPPVVSELGDGEPGTTMLVDAAPSSVAGVDPALPSPELSDDAIVERARADMALCARAGVLIDDLPDQYRDDWRAYVRKSGISANWQRWTPEQAQSVIDWVMTEDDPEPFVLTDDEMAAQAGGST